MLCNFNYTFHPTPKQHEEQVDFLNKLIDDNIASHGNNCHACAHKIHKKETPFWIDNDDEYCTVFQRYRRQ